MIHIVRRQKRILQCARDSLRAPKYADHIYSNRQHVIFLALPQLFKGSYQGFCNLMETCTIIIDELRFDNIPHFTILQNFSSKTETMRLGRFLFACLDEARLRLPHLVVESTGFSSTNASFYYTRTLEIRTGKRGRPLNTRLIKRYLKQILRSRNKKTAHCIHQNQMRASQQLARLHQSPEETLACNTICQDSRRR